MRAPNGSVARTLPRTLRDSSTLVKGAAVLPLKEIPSFESAVIPLASQLSSVSTNLTKGDHPAYLTLYFLLIVFFAFFYVAISFNPEEVADNMKKYGGFIPGIRAGRPTAEYLSYVLNRITWPGSLYLGLIALAPTVALASYSGANQIGGTSILIIVGVGLETVKQIESQLQQRNYEGFLR